MAGDGARWRSRGQADRSVRRCGGVSVNCPTRCDRSDGTMTSRRHSARRTGSSISPGRSNPTSRIPTGPRTTKPRSPPRQHSRIYRPNAWSSSASWARGSTRRTRTCATRPRRRTRCARLELQRLFPVRSHLRPSQRARPDRLGVRCEVRQSHAARQWDTTVGSAVPGRCCGSDPSRRARSRHTDGNVRVRRTRHHDCRRFRAPGQLRADPDTPNTSDAGSAARTCRTDPHTGACRCDARGHGSNRGRDSDSPTLRRRVAPPR